jgi:hypothetical protein
MDFPIQNYAIDDGSDIDGKGSNNTIYSHDGTGSLVLDGNGLAHVWWGNVRLLDDDLGDEAWTYFSSTDGLSYWNESMGTGTQNYRHVYGMRSTDNGTTWSIPIDITPDVAGDFFECIYPIMTEEVTDKVRLIYQRNYKPGFAVQGDLDFSGISEIIYMEVDTIFGSPDAI